MQTPLHITHHNGIATLTLNRPERHNAFDAATIAALDAAFDTMAKQPEVRVVVLAASGPTFCAGADLDWMRAAADQTPAENLDDARRLARMLQKLATLDKPTIARVQGPAYGGGVGLIAACDMAIATRDARFALTEVRLGLIPATISPHVIRAIGPRQAHRYFLTAENFTAHTAQEIGLLHEVLNDAAALDECLQRLTHTLLKNGPCAIAASKRLIDDFADHSGQPRQEDLIEDTAQRIANQRAGEEAREGMAAFLERRRPRWSPKENAPCSKKS